MDAVLGHRARIRRRPRSTVLIRMPLPSVDLRPLRDSRDFRLLWLGQIVSMVGRQITVVAVPYQIFQTTHSALAVGMLGLVQVVPLIVFSLAGGALADRVDRRRLLLLTNTLLAGCSGLFLGGAVAGNPPLAFLYAVAATGAAVSAFDQPARAATIPRMVRPDQLAAALALNFGLFMTTLVAGPAVGGLVIARLGLAAAYLVDVVTFAAAIAAVALISPQPPTGARRESPLQAIRSGLSYARRQPVVLAGFAIDLDAMVFGMPRALFPVLAATTFHTGPGGLGLLYAAPGAGAVVAAALSTGWVGRVHAQGQVVVVSVAVWGAAILGFGLTASLPLALALLAMAGAADSVSAVCRTTMLQTVTVDEYRGRMSATYSMVVVGGPYIGDVEAGAVAQGFGARASVVSGGVLCVLGAGLVAATLPVLWRYRAPTTAGVSAASVDASRPEAGGAAG